MFFNVTAERYAFLIDELSIAINQALAGMGIQKLAGDAAVADCACFLVFKLSQATETATIAEGFPLFLRHFV